MPAMLALMLVSTPPSSAYVQIRNQGADAGAARILNCSGLSCSVDSTSNLATITPGYPLCADGGSSLSLLPDGGLTCYGPFFGTCALDGGTPGQCNLNVPTSSCVATIVGTTRASALAGLAINVSGGVLTATADNGHTETVNVLCK